MHCTPADDQWSPLRRLRIKDYLLASSIATATATCHVKQPAVVAEAELSDDPMSKLSDKEKEVAELICLGHSNADIADILFISVQTVKTHTKRIYLKTDVHSRMELAALINKYQSAKKQ